MSALEVVDVDELQRASSSHVRTAPARSLRRQPADRRSGASSVGRLRRAHALPGGGEAPRERGREGWHDFWLPDGAYAGMPAWLSRGQWLDAVAAALATPAGQQLRRAIGPSAATVMRVAHDDAANADTATGRGLETSHRKVAERLGVSEDTVRKSRRIIARLGLADTARKGRHTDAKMRQEAYEFTGRNVWRIASTRALVMPRGSVSSPPPTPKGVGLDPLVHRTHQTRRRRARTAPLTTTKANAQPRSLRVQRVAAHLNHELPYLTRQGRHIGALCTILERAFAPWNGLDALPRGARRAPNPEIPRDKGHDPDEWTALVVKEAVDHWHLTQQRTALAMDARDPLAGFAWALAQAITTATVERLRADLRHSERRANQQVREDER